MELVRHESIQMNFHGRMNKNISFIAFLSKKQQKCILSITLTLSGNIKHTNIFDTLQPSSYYRTKL